MFLCKRTILPSSIENHNEGKSLITRKKKQPSIMFLFEKGKEEDAGN